ncbi:Uncharacterised protein [Oligella urethralis]|uniref:hypothetical protein n=1 Tax=Oligella urethralis TaxID=90245 RepID=UPI000DFE3F94|nr:hypothetical protein [Oligella urethralis]SUA63399.1 Uncharacterised protein [Oligella urethralis]
MKPESKYLTDSHYWINPNNLLFSPYSSPPINQLLEELGISQEEFNKELNQEISNKGENNE